MYIYLYTTHARICSFTLFRSYVFIIIAFPAQTVSLCCTTETGRTGRRPSDEAVD